MQLQFPSVSADDASDRTAYSGLLHILTAGISMIWPAFPVDDDADTTAYSAIFCSTVNNRNRWGLSPSFLFKAVPLTRTPLRFGYGKGIKLRLRGHRKGTKFRVLHGLQGLMRRLRPCMCLYCLGLTV